MLVAALPLAWLLTTGALAPPPAVITLQSPNAIHTVDVRVRRLDGDVRVLTGASGSQDADGWQLRLPATLELAVGAEVTITSSTGDPIELRRDGTPGLVMRGGALHVRYRETRTGTARLLVGGEGVTGESHVEAP